MQVINKQVRQPASDGAGVKLQRVHGFKDNSMNPFLMLDQICADDSDDYIAGFPAHPHRGFETLTYLKKGTFSHEDSMGNKGAISAGGVQWMSAGSGVIHSEMPAQSDDGMLGFQLWINLAAKDKMKQREYRDVQPEQLPWHDIGQSQVKIIAGHVGINGQVFTGALQSLPAKAAIIDLEMAAKQTLVIDAEARKVQLLIYAGASEQGHKNCLLELKNTEINLASSEQGMSAILLLGQPINEPVSHYGPFVMNTQQEIEQAISDYNQGQLVQTPPNLG